MSDVRAQRICLGHRRTDRILSILAVIVTSACTKQSHESTPHDPSLAVPAPDGTGNVSTSMAPIPYPRARWRLDQNDLPHVVLWASDILIRHDGSDRQVPFFMGWNIEPPPPHRTRAEALRLATLAATRAAAAPAAFANLAHEYSEDIVTRDAGGSVGGVTASELLFDGSLLDALAALKVGEVSRVVETRHGFHVLLRRAPPPLTTFAARRIVLDYDGAGLPGAHSKSTRSRDDALAMARGLSVTLRADPSKFETLVERMSPPDVASQRGYIGVWTNQEPGSFEREREALAGMRVGEIGEPIDGREGIQIFVRDPIPAEHQEYGVRVLKVALSSSPPPPGVEVSPPVDPDAIARMLTLTPERFEALERQYCCMRPERWSDGRTRGALLAAVKGLAIGSIAPTPINDPPFLIFVKRIDPADASIPSVLFDLPSPQSFDVAQYAAGASGTAVQKLIGGIADAAARELELSRESAKRLKELHARLAESFQTGRTQQSREAAIAAFRVDVQNVLSSEQYHRYQQLARRTVSATVMDQW